MPTLSPRPVLVTGSNRSGTTWVGRMLCLSRELTYVHEPFNPGIWPRWTAEPIPYRNLYVCAENGHTYEAQIRDVLEQRFPFARQLRDVRSARDAARLARDGIRHRVDRAASRSTLMKDPIAVFSAEWLADRFDMAVVMMVRSPVAFAGSVKRLSWKFDFGQWARQPLLLRDHLGEFGEEIRRAADAPPDILTQAILTWNATYAYVDRMRAAHPDWHIVSYEDLAGAPTAGFESLFHDLGLTFDERAATGVVRHSDHRNTDTVSPRDKGGIRRDSTAALDTWQHRLTPEEVERVEHGTKAVAARLDVTARGAQ
ncbi:MAG: sulfotransferase [Microthrixaceae bacterium]